MSHTPSTVLGRITGPQHLRGLSPDERTTLARELRGRICEVVSKNGGHFGSNLGVVELTIALHTVFESPRDRIVFDVSHQCYPHKLLTGRNEGFETLRTYEGTSGFCHKGESEHDTAYAGHAGTATSIALGIAAADKLRGVDRHVISVVGDASMVSGMTLEALNHAGWIDARLLIILNDNGMSISFPVGGLHHALTSVRGTGQPGQNPYTPRQHETMLPRGDQDVRPFFESLGLRYEGPFDGHDTEELIATLQRIKDRPGPTLLHIHTRKGHGWDPSIADPITWHAAKNFMKNPGAAPTPALATPVATGAKPRPSWTQAFTRAMIDAAKDDPRLVAITAAMLGGTGLDAFAKVYPERTFDVGICEQHGVGFGSGMRLGGLRPVLAIYSTFLQRGYDQVLHDLAIQGNPAVLCMDRGGLVGDDGVTHQGLFDIAYLRCIPDIVLMAPADEPELRAMLRWALRSDRIVGIRYPRDTVPEPFDPDPMIRLGKGKVVRGGEGDVAFFAYGAMVPIALEAADLLAQDSVRTSVANGRFAKPVDADLLIDLLERHEVVVTVEDHAREGGFGSACVQAVLDRRPELASRLRIAGVPDAFVHHGARPLQLRDAGLDAPGLAARALAAMLTAQPLADPVRSV